MLYGTKYWAIKKQDVHKRFMNGNTIKIESKRRNSLIGRDGSYLWKDETKSLEVV